MGIERAIGKNIIKHLASQLLPSWQIVQTVRSLGYGYRYQEMLDDIRTYSGRVKYETQVSNLSDDATIPEGWMAKEEFVSPYRYRVYGTVRYYNAETGEYEEGMRSFFTNDPGSKSSYTEKFEDYFYRLQYDPTIEYVDFEVKGVVRNTNW